MITIIITSKPAFKTRQNATPINADFLLAMSAQAKMGHIEQLQIHCRQLR